MLRAAKRQVGLSVGRAFTLVEILIVVVILGILAAIVVPAFGSATEESRASAFATSVTSMSRAMRLYQAREGLYPPDLSTGVWGPELSGYIHEADYESETPIGGQWDIETNDSTVTHAVGVIFTAGAVPLAALQTADEIMDNGDLATGSFRTIRADGYYWVIRE